MSASSAPVIVAARRTWIGTAGHGHADVGAADLAAPVLAAALADLPASHGLTVEDVALGNCTGPGGNLARVAVLAAALDDPAGPLTEQVPGITVDRQCGSGLAAILLAAHGVRAGEGDLVLAGGVESPSTAPLRARRPRRGSTAPPIPYDRAPFTPPEYGDPDMGAAADTLARDLGIGRERQDAYAVRSHARALAAHAAGRFDAEAVAVGDLARDERARALDPALLARLPSAFTPGGAVTAGNASPISDGAAVVAVVPEHVRARLGLPGLRLVRGVTRGSDPRLPGWGPVPAVRELLARTGRGIDDLAAIELVEAFAAQVLAFTDALSLPDDDARLCADGGALALGHPWGASGAVSVVRLFSRLVRSGAPTGSLGLTAAAVGGGLGVSALFEVVR
ncbi:thiolase family protein [Oerskovia sp. Sa1BUA8]|uniref:Probable acetyl-CoA acetyltransferase n=1 Tax=Oerskovia douganii TaxID=2762210 RepID=A0A9D5UE66_9CELL|nr:thiolase family protein [Oerskovia douganii]MBE7701406.1 thiolase family protein [Oerskovia douganii]